MADVGARAGVSAQTVSRYFRGAGYVSSEARARIEAAVQELDYHFNQSARSLRVDSTNTIGVLVAGPSLWGPSTIFSGLYAAAHLADYALLTSRVEDEPSEAGVPDAVQRALRRFIAARVDGLIVSSPYDGTEGLLAPIWDALPVVALALHTFPAADTVIVDSYAAGLGGTRHLLELGHRQIAHIAGPENRLEARERERGYADAMREAGARPQEPLRGDWSARSGHEIGSTVDPSSFTAVMSGNDEMALGFMSAMSARGLTAPGDYSIVGVDDMPSAAYFAPALTTMAMDFETQGKVGFEMLIDRIATHRPPRQHVIPPHLVVRQSSRPRR